MSDAAPQSTAATFTSSGVRVAATVYAESETGEGTPPPDRRPAVLLCPGFSGVQDTPTIVATARAFAAAGWRAVTFDYRGFGRSDGEPRQVLSVRDQLADIRAAVAYLRSRPDVRGEQVGLWGSSLGGGHVITIASEDARIAGVVAQVPFNGFPREPAEQGRTRKDAYALLVTAVRDRVRGWLGRRPLYVKAVGAVGERAVMVSEDANRTIEVLTSGTWRNEIAPRGLLDMMAYRPGKAAHRVQAPLLVCVGEYDQETQGATTEPLARDAPRGELRTYPFAHFDIYRPEIREQVLRDQVEFLRHAFAREQT